MGGPTTTPKNVNAKVPPVAMLAMPGGAAAAPAAAGAAPAAAASVKPQVAGEINGLAIFWALVKGWFSGIFGKRA